MDSPEPCGTVTLMRARKGFTLVELIVALAVVSIMLVMGVATFAGVNARAHDSIGQDVLGSASVQLRRTASQSDFRFLPRALGCPAGTSSLAGAAASQSQKAMNAANAGTAADFTIAVTFPSGKDSCSSSGTMSLDASTSRVVALSVKTTDRHCEARVENISPFGDEPASTLFSWDTDSPASPCKVDPACLSYLADHTWASQSPAVASRTAYQGVDMASPAVCTSKLG